MESFLRASSSTNLFVDDDQCIDYFFGLAQEAPLSPEPWVVAPAPGMSVDHHFGSLVSLDDEFTPPATEPASPIHDGFPRGDVKVDAMVGSADLLDLFDSTLSTAPSSPIGDCMLTPAASSLATPLASPQLHGCQPNRFFPTFFLGGGADSTDMIFQGASPVSLATTPERLYSTDSEEEEIDVESVVDAKTRGMVPKEGNKARVAPSASRRRRSVAGSETSPARKARRGSTTVRAAMVAAAANAVMAAATASTTSSDESMDGDSAGALDDELKKRNVHNILERKRREDLKFSFQMLRERVPDIAHDERAPKVVILKQATGHIHILKARQLDIQAEKEKLLHQQRTLQERLRQLQYH